MIAVILGPDAALVRDESRRLSRERDQSGESTSELDGKIASLGDVLTSAASAGFFGTGRVVIVHDLLARFGKTGKGAKTGGSETSGPDWSGLFAAIPPENTLILADPSLSALPATVRKALPPDAITKVCAPPRGHELVGWLRATAKQAESNLDAETARFLAERVYPQTWANQPSNPTFDRPPDMDTLRNEIEKLALAAHPAPITRTHVTAMVAAGDVDRVFRFIEAASAGRLSDALIELDRLLVAGEDPAKLFAQLAQNAELSLTLATAERRSPADVGRDIGLSNANRMVAIARGVRDQPQGLSAHAARALTSADRRLKRGELRDPLAALYDAVVSISTARRASTPTVARR
ncbi:MAG: hypothetical protein H0W06_08460 [Chloroflexia bacterium]|nr:hypothetical protein [Chloroflexia bacterium]